MLAMLAGVLAGSGWLLALAIREGATVVAASLAGLATVAAAVIVLLQAGKAPEEARRQRLGPFYEQMAVLAGQDMHQREREKLRADFMRAALIYAGSDGSDPHHAQARALLTGWQEEDGRRLISVMNLSEVLVAPAIDTLRLRAAREAISALGVAVHRPTEGIGVAAARLRCRHPISLPDAYCLATAKHAGGSVASFDRKVIRAAEAEQIARAAEQPVAPLTRATRSA